MQLLNRSSRIDFRFASRRVPNQVRGDRSRLKHAKSFKFSFNRLEPHYTVIIELPPTTVEPSIKSNVT